MVQTGRICEDHDHAAARRTRSLAALATTLALIVVGLYLVEALRSMAAEQDCALSGCRAEEIAVSAPPP